ncbi:MAG: UbiD family decarboxylase, partial [Syntrophomonadaceae bacterium]|nr:UbiD family decarboxylase [Syntrophomonadaceae bacterium]
MGFRDIREFIRALEQRGWLKRIAAEVDPVLEITEITDRVSKAGGPALLFENVKGSRMPLLINAFGSRERMELALGVESIDDIAQDILSFLQPNIPYSFWDKLKLVPKLKEVASFLPKTVKKAPCQEVVNLDPSLDDLPVLKCWPGDGGKFITLPLVFTRDPDTGRRNAGMYRMQVFDSRTTGMHWHLHHDGSENYRKMKRRGQRMEVAVALGGDPATIYAATAPLPKDIDEMIFAGFLRKEPVEMVRCRSIDMEVPANAEIILEGYVDPQETRLEGPFGDHTGYYSLCDYYPVFHLTCMTHRRNPIYPTTIVG